MQLYKEKIKLLAQLTEEEDEIDRKWKVLQVDISKLKSEIQALLEADGMDKMETEDGRVTLAVIKQISMPKDSENKNKLFDYLKDKGLFEDMITINHQKLNSFYKQEMDANKENPFFQVAGIDTAFQTIQPRFTRAKNGN